MSVSIEDVLSLLPELFPGIQQILLKNIRPNPENPGNPISEEDIQSQADNMAERGLDNAIKVQPDRAKPLVDGVQLHPDDPRLAVAGSPIEPAQPKRGPQLEASVQVIRPWELDDFNYMILVGERRWRAADRLKWERIDGYILNPPPEEVPGIIRNDNVVRERGGWWADYQSIEMEIKANPNQTQKQVSTRLMMDRDKVGMAIGLLPLLNPEARALISGQAANSNKGILGISGKAAYQLVALGPGTGFKPGVKKKAPAEGEETQKLYPYPPIPPETQDLVYRALVVANDQEMTESQVKGLVVHIQQGGKPEDYKPGKKPPKPPKDGPGGGSGSSDDSSKGSGPGGSGGSGGSGGGGSTPSETPKEAGSPQSTVHSKQNNQKTLQPSGAGSTTEPALPNPKPGLESQPKGVQGRWQAILAALKPAAALTGKTGEKTAKRGWHMALRYEHEFCKWVAGLVVPHPKSGHGGSTGARQLLAPLHWAVYGLCQMVFWWLLLAWVTSLFAPGLRPWIAFPFRYLAYWIFDYFPAWAWALAVQNLVYAIAAAVLLVVGIISAFNYQPLRTVLLIILLMWGWYHGRAWGTKELPTSTAPVADNQFSPPSTSANSSKELAQPNHGPQLGASGQVQDTKNDTEALVPSAPVTTAQAIKPSNISTSKPSHKAPKVLTLEAQMKALEMPAELNDRTKKACGDAAQFAVSFYGITYHGLRDWADCMDNYLSTDYRHEFYKEYFSDDWRKELDSQKEYETFEPSRPPKLLRWDDNSDDWQVEGTVTLRSDLAYDGKFISKEHKVLTISMAHFRDGSEAVYEVKETGK